MKKLYRSEKDKVVAGVLGGFAEYTNVDPTVVRLGYVLITLFSFFAGVLFYIIAWIIIPVNVSHKSEGAQKESKPEEDKGEEIKVSHETESKKEDE